MTPDIPPALQDTAIRLPIHPMDSVADKRLVGDWIVSLIQFFFQQPPWVMWGGALVGAGIAAFLLRRAWQHRQALREWLVTRNRQVKLALAGGVAAAVLLALTAALGSYHFVEKDPRFCQGCHIFVRSGEAWIQPDTGWYSLVPMLEGKHDSLGCHTCHPLKPLKEGVKLIFWMSGIRDKEIPEHARVPRPICEQCHVQGRAEVKEKWKAIAATAGHRTHLESDSSALQGKIECLTCHARTAHRFQPADSTCGQSDCHKPSETRIVLGKMKSQGEFHCVACHEFTAYVPALATRDSAVSTLTPAIRNCFRCHAMRQRLPDFDERKDPHKGTCGMCHKPHTQTSKTETIKTCADRACHGLWYEVPFHVGVQHRRKAQQCTLCHQPHAARVDASDCVGCHEAVRSYRAPERLFPPLPFDTLKALQSLAPEPPVPPEPPPAGPERPSKVKGDAPPGDSPPGRTMAAPPALQSDSFPHPRHQKLACLTCHLSKTGARLTFEAPRGCQICHHQNPARNECTNCHKQDRLPATVAVTVSIAAAEKPARERSVAFGHKEHHELRCTDCHGQAVTMAPVDSALTCQGCHDQHHEAGRDCARCHRTASITQVHAQPARVHVACDACHPTAAIAPLSPTRSLCLACHGPALDHNESRECSSCHLQASPEAYRPRLLKVRKTG